MADPTLKDVLNAIGTLTGAVGRLEKGQAALEKGQAAIRRDMATKGDVEAVRDEVDALRSDVEGGFAAVGERLDALDRKLDTFQGVLASPREDTRDLRADVTALHKPLVRASRRYDRGLARRARRQQPGTRPTNAGRRPCIVTSYNRTSRAWSRSRSRSRPRHR